MKIGAFFIWALFLLPLIAGENEDTYFEEKCLPLVRDFIRRNALPYDASFPTNRISHRQVEFSPASTVYLSRMMLDKRFAFLFTGTQHLNSIDSYSDKGSSWRPSLMDPNNEQQMHLLAERTNLLVTTSALALAREYFRLQGHDEKNFKPVKFEQMVWADAIPSRRIVLPFYEAEWLRKDATPAHGLLPPSVRIIVSGLESNLAHYSKIALPIERGQDWERPGQTNRARRK